MENKVERMYLENFTANLFFQNEAYIDYLTSNVEWKLVKDNIILEGIGEIKNYLNNNYNDVETINIDEAITQNNKSVVSGQIFCKDDKIIYFCNIYVLQLEDKIQIKTITTFIN